MIFLYKIFNFHWILRCLAVVFLFINLTNCAIFQRKNLILVNAVEENLVPKDDSAKIWASPFYIPVGILAGALDVFVVHPISVIPKAANDTLNALWTDRNNLPYVTRMGVIPFSLLLSGPMFTLSWSYHWLFEDSTEESKGFRPNKTLTTEEWISKLEIAIESNSNEEIGDLLNLCELNTKTDKQIKLLIKVYQKYKSNARLNLSSMALYCLLSKGYYNPTIEDFVVQIFLKDHSLDIIYNNRNNLVAYFIQNRSQKGSKALIEMLSDESLNNRWIPFIVDNLFIFGYKEEKDEIINRVIKKKYSI